MNGNIGSPLMWPLRGALRLRCGECGSMSDSSFWGAFITLVLVAPRV